MSRRTRTTILILAGLLALAPLCVIGLFGEAATEEAAQSTLQTRMPQETQKNVSNDNVYLVKAHEGHLAVYDWEVQDTPVEVTDIDIRLMRQVDRERMERGIQVTGDETLARVLEDFLP